MSMSRALKFGISSGSPRERLARVLKENKDRYSISKDGFISVKMDNTDVQAAIEKQINKLADIKEGR